MELPKSGLSIESGELIRRSKSAIVARHSLESIAEIKLVYKWDLFAVIFVATLFALCVVCKVFIPVQWLAWMMFVGLAGTALLVGIGARVLHLRLTTTHGSVDYILSDLADESHGFAIALRDAAARVRGVTPKAG